MKGITGNGEKADVQFLFLISRPLLVQFNLIDENLDPIDMYDKDKGGFNLSEWTKFFKDLLKVLKSLVININIDVTILLKMFLLSVMYSAAPAEGLDDIIKTFNKIIQRDVKAAIKSTNNNRPVTINYLGGGKRYTRRKINKQKGGANAAANEAGAAAGAAAENANRDSLSREMLTALSESAREQEEAVSKLVKTVYDGIENNPIVKAHRNDFKGRRSPCGRTVCKIGLSLNTVILYILIISAIGGLAWNYDTIQIAAQQQAILARSGSGVNWGTSIFDSLVYITAAIPSLGLSLISRIGADNFIRPLFVGGFILIAALTIIYSGQSLINIPTQGVKIHRVAVRVDRMLKDDIETFTSMLSGIVAYSATEGIRGSATGIEKLIKGALPINNSLNRIKSLKAAVQTNNIRRQLNEISKSGTRSIYNHFSTKSSTGVKKGIENVLVAVLKKIDDSVANLLESQGDLTTIRKTIEGIYNDEHVQKTLEKLDELYARIKKMSTNENDFEKASDEYLKDFETRGQQLITDSKAAALYLTGIATAATRITTSVAVAGGAAYMGQPSLALGIFTTGAPEIAGMIKKQEDDAKNVKQLENIQKKIDDGIMEGIEKARVADLERKLAAFLAAAAPAAAPAQ